MPRKPWLFAVILIALAALGIALLLLSLAPSHPVSPLPLSLAPSHPVSPLPLSSPSAPSAPSRPAPDPTFTPSISPTPTRKPTPTFYVTLYPYSLDSLEGWSFYTDTQLKIAFPYPAEPPRVVYIEREQSWDIQIQAHWDPTKYWARAYIIISIWEGFDKLPLDACVTEIARRGFGDPKGYGDKIEPPDPELVNALLRAGAEEVAVYAPLGVPRYLAKYKGRVYKFGQGFETQSVAQDRILKLIIQNIRFLP